jgi:hypothetical protein
MSPSGGGTGDGARSARSSILRMLPWILLIEAIIDIAGLPFDELLIPAEVVLDVGILALSALSTLGGSSSGRAIGASSGPRRNRSGIASVNGWVLLIYWAFVVGLFVFQGWFALREPLLFLLFGIFILGFDVILVLVGTLLTLGTVFGRAQSNAGRQIGSGKS